MQLRHPFPRVRHVADVADSPRSGPFIFTVFVLVGSAYIVDAKLRGFAQVYVTFVPVATMLAYALLIHLARNLRLRDDQAGDNLYYMGFLFTLTSLGVSLYQFSAAHAAEDIVQNFGIAIGSTITGIALRVIFNQMRRDPIEVERIMRLELAEAARRVRRELDSTAVEFSYVRRSAHQAATDSFNLVAEKFDAISARLMASMADVASKSAGQLEAASRHSSEAIEEVTRTIVGALRVNAGQLSAETERLSKSALEISAALDKVGAKLQAMRMPDGVIEFHLEPGIRSLSRAVDRFTARSDEQAAAVKKVLEAAKVAVETSSTAIVALRQTIDVNSGSNHAASEAATKVIAAMAQILDDFKSDTGEQVELLRQLLERTDRAIRTLTDLLAASSADTNTDGLRDVPPASPRALTLAAESVAEVADDHRSRRVASKRGAIE
jgi:hypothetical protein